MDSTHNRTSTELLSLAIRSRRGNFHGDIYAESAKDEGERIESSNQVIYKLSPPLPFMKEFLCAPYL